MRLTRFLYVLLTLMSLLISRSVVAQATSRHGAGIRYPTYEGLVMCGYQGWFRAAGDEHGGGWVHYCRGSFDSTNLTVDLWPDVSEYPQTYPTRLKNRDGTPARVFSSWDESTVDVHFRWMKEYGLDGAFVQRFYGVTRSAQSRANGRVVLGHALKAARQHGRAIAVMYDLSGIRATGDDCECVIQDWKELVDALKLTSSGEGETYLYHRGKPLVAVWGVGFPDRPFDFRRIGLEKLLDFLKNDPVYGGCSVMLGVPARFRELNGDCVSDAYLHELLRKADVIMPWTVGRYSSLAAGDIARYGATVKADVVWCAERKLDYAACVFPGFSWYNLMRQRGEAATLNAIPRQGGKFFWELIAASVQAGARMLYVAMFDEIDEGTAIFKCANSLPEAEQPGKLLGYEGVPADHYLWLAGKGGEALKGKTPIDTNLYQNTSHRK